MTISVRDMRRSRGDRQWLELAYRDYLNEVIMTFRFHPARAPSGEAVPGTKSMDILLPSK